MIRERQVGTAAYSSGQQSIVDLPRDAVYHMIQLSVKAGTVSVDQGADTGTGLQYESNFPFSIIRNLRLIRNGSDVVFQGSGAQLAKEHYYLNHSHPFARIYSVASNVETLLTAATRGVTVPANAQGIGANGGGFTMATSAGNTVVNRFDFLMELWLQIAPDDGFYGTLVDARKLASFQLEINWAQLTDFQSPGVLNTNLAVTATVQISSIDQDNLDVNANFGTFKRSSFQRSDIGYSASDQQVILPRGNYFHGIQLQTRKTHDTITAFRFPDDGIISTFVNRLNTNFQLRQTSFNDLQRKNSGDAEGRQTAWQTSSGGPQGYAYLYYASAGQRMAELVPTYVLDTFDLLINTRALADAENTPTEANTNPVLDFLLEEVIPGVSVSENAPRGSQFGSKRGTSAKPYA